MPFDGPGIDRHPYADMGSKSILRGSLFLRDVRVPAGNLIGTPNGAFGPAMQTFEYTRGRMAFGQPVSRKQGLSFPVAEWWSRLQMARWHCLRTLWLRDVCGQFIADGTPRIQKLIIARHLFGRVFV